MTQRIALALLLAASFACGGGPQRPTPLRTTIDDMYLASIGMDQKQAVLQAQNDYAKAKMEYANADHSFQEAKSKIKIAHNDLQRAKLDRSSARSNQADAKRTADLNKVKAADRELKVADAEVTSAKAGINAWQARKSAMKHKKLWAEENMYAAQARYELAKAKLAKQHQISPVGFDYGKFESQAKERSRRAQKRRVKVDSSLAKAKQKWSKYQAAQAQVNKLKGSAATSSSTTD